MLSQDEARSPMVPTPAAALGVKGHRPRVGAWDCKDLLYVFAVVNVLTGALLTNPLECPKDAKRQTGQSKTRRRQEAFARHLRHIGRQYPRDRHKRVVLLIDNAPWHEGTPVKAAVAENPHPELERLPSYSPTRNPIERFWGALRRRATHNRRFDQLADLKQSVRNSLRYEQTMRERVKGLVNRQPRRTETGQNH